MSLVTLCEQQQEAI